MALDVAITAPRAIFVRGRGLDAELSLDAHVGGTTAAPDLTGRGERRAGLVRLLRQKVRLQRVEHRDPPQRTKPELIRLDLDRRAQRRTGWMLSVRITGTVAQPRDNADVHRLSFRRTKSCRACCSECRLRSLSPFEAAQLASAVTALATGGGLDVLGQPASVRRPRSTGAGRRAVRRHDRLAASI